MLGVQGAAKERGMSGAEQGRERGGENGRRKRKKLTGGSGMSVARGELLVDGPALARERVTRVRRERADVLGLAPRGLSAGGGKLGRAGCLGHAVGVLCGPLSEGEEMGWTEIWQLGPG